MKEMSFSSILMSGIAMLVCFACLDRVYWYGFMAWIQCNGDGIMGYRMKIVLLAGVVGMLVLSSCATMKKEECLTADWYQIGYEDGTRGYPVNRVGLHRKACSKYSVTPDFELYQRGREEGLVEYCTPHKGYQLGLSGRQYNDVCQGESKTQFMVAYNTGRDIYLFQRDVQKEEREQDKRLNEIARIEKEIVKKEAGLSNDCKDQAKCKRSLDEIRALDREKERLESTVRSKTYEIESMKKTLYDMKSQSRF